MPYTAIYRKTHNNTYIIVLNCTTQRKAFDAVNALRVQSLVNKGKELQKKKQKNYTAQKQLCSFD